MLPFTTAFPAGKSAITIVQQILRTDVIATMNATVTNKGKYKEYYLQKLYPMPTAIIESNLFMVLYVLYCTAETMIFFEGKGLMCLSINAVRSISNNCNLKSLERAVNDIYFYVSKLIKISNC